MKTVTDSRTHLNSDTYTKTDSSRTTAGQQQDITWAH